MPVIWLTSIASAFNITKNTKTKYNYRYYYKVIINFPISSKAKRNDVLFVSDLLFSKK